MRSTYLKISFQPYSMDPLLYFFSLDLKRPIPILMHSSAISLCLTYLTTIQQGAHKVIHNLHEVLKGLVLDSPNLCFADTQVC